MADNSTDEYADTDEEKTILEFACSVTNHTNSRRAKETAEVTNGVDNSDTCSSSRTGKELSRNCPEQRNSREHAAAA